MEGAAGAPAESTWLGGDKVLPPFLHVPKVSAAAGSRGVEQGHSSELVELGGCPHGMGSLSYLKESPPPSPQPSQPPPHPHPQPSLGQAREWGMHCTLGANGMAGKEGDAGACRGLDVARALKGLSVKHLCAHKHSHVCVCVHACMQAGRSRTLVVPQCSLWMGSMPKCKSTARGHDCCMP